MAQALRANLKAEDGEFVNPWVCDLATLMLDARAFHESPVDHKKCCKLITKILWMLFQGERFQSDDMISLFFGVTKLFQCDNKRLRRLTYLIIKTIEPSETESFIVTQCLIKDVNGKNDAYRANGIRVLSKIVDASVAGQISDRFLKTAVVDKNQFVATSAILCGMHLLKVAPDLIKRWVNEIQEVVNNGDGLPQYHALALLYELKRNDRLALHKVITQLAKQTLRSPMAECLLLRYASTALMAKDSDPAIQKPLMTYIDGCLRAKMKAEMVTHEAAKCFVNLIVYEANLNPGETPNHLYGFDFSRAIDVLQISLSSSKPVVRFAAARCINQLAQVRPQLVSRCNTDLEPLLTDQNRSTATLALTTLLKTGNEKNVDHLVKQISSFMSEISDPYKIEVVRAVRVLALEYPNKARTVMNFLSSNLREEGSADFKRDLVEALITVCEKIPAQCKDGLLHLCEFIEDCEYPNLCTQVLSFLGDMIPTMPVPAKYIRFIYNRLILENALVRASSVDALAKVANKVDSLREDILTLLQCNALDNDDEVRDRIAFYVQLLQKSENRAVLFSPDLPFSVDSLYETLEKQLLTENMRAVPVDFKTLPTKQQYDDAQAAREKEAKAQATATAAAGAAEKSHEAVATANTELLSKLGPSFAAQAGNFVHCTKAAHLTEAEAEYTVDVIKHIFQNVLVLEFYVTNTIEGVALSNTVVELTATEGGMAVAGAVPCPDIIKYESHGSCYVVIARTDPSVVASTEIFTARLKFNQLEDGDDIGFPDEYPIENVFVVAGDYMVPSAIPHGQFPSLFEQMPHAVQTKLMLEFKSLDVAVQGIINSMNMEPCDKSGTVEAGKTAHTILLCGTFMGSAMVVAKVLVGVDPQGRILLQMQVKSKSPEAAQLVSEFLE